MKPDTGGRKESSRRGRVIQGAKSGPFTLSQRQMSLGCSVWSASPFFSGDAAGSKRASELMSVTSCEVMLVQVAAGILVMQKLHARRTAEGGAHARQILVMC